MLIGCNTILHFVTDISMTLANVNIVKITEAATLNCI